MRGERWGPRTLDVDLIACYDGATEVIARETNLTLPHPLAQLRAFVMVPWLAVDPDAGLTVAGTRGPSPDCWPSWTRPTGTVCRLVLTPDARAEIGSG